MLAWMPAHTAASAIGIVKRSDGVALTPLDRRANALVDGLAKLAASEQQVPLYIANLFKAAEIAVEHAAASVGVICKAANNAMVPHETRNDDGSVNLVKRRDSIPMAQLQRREATLKLRAAAAIRRQDTRDRRAAARTVAAHRSAQKKRASLEAKRQAEAAVRERLSLKREAELGRPTPKPAWRDPAKVAANNKMQNARRAALKRGLVYTEPCPSTASSSSATQTPCSTADQAPMGVAVVPVRAPVGIAMALATTAVDQTPADGAVGRWWAAKLAKRARLSDLASVTPDDQVS